MRVAESYIHRVSAASPARRGYADSPFGQLHYAETGAWAETGAGAETDAGAETGAGPVLLLLHQTPRSHDEFREVQPLLADPTVQA